eukprot:1428574-Amphidinium_carterae.1
MLSAPEAEALPVAFEVGATSESAEVLVFWLHGNEEDPKAARDWLECLVQGGVSIEAGSGEFVRVSCKLSPSGFSFRLPPTHSTRRVRSRLTFKP